MEWFYRIKDCKSGLYLNCKAKLDLNPVNPMNPVKMNGFFSLSPAISNSKKNNP
jgi:hypothetical protein